LLLNDIVGFLQLLSLVLDLLFILTVLLQDEFFLLLHDILLLLDNLLDSRFDSCLHSGDIINFVCLRLLQDFFKTFILFVKLVDSELVFHMLFLEQADFVFSLLSNDLSLRNLFDELFVLLLGGSDSLDFVDVLSFQNGVLDLIFRMFVSFDHKSFQEDVDLIDVVQL